MLRSHLLLAGLLFVPLAAHADSFNYSITVPGLGSSSGTLTATDNHDPLYGSFTVQSITSTSGPAVSLLGPDPTLGNDNLIFPRASLSQLLDGNGGLGFSGSFGQADVFSTIAGYEVQGFDATGTYFDVTGATFTLAATSAPTPEPSSLALAFTGLAGGVTELVRRRAAKKTVA